MKPDDPSDDATTMLRTLHRAAADRVDPEPGPQVRAAVLAAATRAVAAKPRDAATGFVPGARQPRRWPRSVAALLVVSVTTGLLATFAMRDSPERITRVATAPPIAAPEPSAGRAAPRVAAESVAGPSPEPRRAVPAQAPSIVPPEPAPRASGRVDPSRKPMPPVTPASPAARSRPPIEADGSQPSAAPRRPTVDAPPTAGASSARPDATAADSDAANASAGRPASEPVVAGAFANSAPEARVGAGTTPAPTASKATLYRGRRVVEPATPEAWVERIVKLRADGQEADADRELDALRLRYPAFEVPPRALAHDGTR